MGLCCGRETRDEPRNWRALLRSLPQRTADNVLRMVPRDCLPQPATRLRLILAQYLADTMLTEYTVHYDLNPQQHAAFVRQKLMRTSVCKLDSNIWVWKPSVKHSLTALPELGRCLADAYQECWEAWLTASLGKPRPNQHFDVSVTN